jgi:CHAT domain-containing protein
VTALQRLYGERVFNLPPLPYSRAEVQGIAGLFSDEEASVLVGEAASEEAVKAYPLDDYRIIHFACHGILDENHPFRSALVLSLIAGQGNDGLLQMREISELTTDADLVVLSACRSARGLLEDAEGPMGLARSFFSAGARSVLASLWSVNDRAAVFFMQEFYKDYLSGHSAREALRTAKMKMLKTAWKHPFYWAGFVLVGDPEAGPPQLTGKSGRSPVMDSKPRQR